MVQSKPQNIGMYFRHASDTMFVSLTANVLVRVKSPNATCGRTTRRIDVCHGPTIQGDLGMCSSGKNVKNQGG